MDHTVSTTRKIDSSRKSTRNADLPTCTIALSTNAECVCATLSVAEAAKIIGCAESTLYQAIKEGKFPSLKIGTTIRIPQPVLERMLATGDMNPKDIEQHTCVDENMAQRVAEIVVMKMLSLEQQGLTEQIRAISPGTYPYSTISDAEAK